MQYWVSMTEEELQAAMALFRVGKLDGITELRDDFDPQLSLYEDMLRKGFFVEEKGERSWNSFVEAVLRCALFAQSRLRLEAPGGPLCCLYFRFDNMVLLSKQPGDPQYMLYYVPLLPRAIGTLAGALRTPELDDCRSAPIAAQTLPHESAAVSAGELMPLLNKERTSGIPESMAALLLADGDCFGTCSLCSAMMRTSQGTLLVAQEHDKLRIIPADYYGALEDISHWIVAAHGRSIAAKEAVSHE